MDNDDTGQHWTGMSLFELLNSENRTLRLLIALSETGKQREDGLMKACANIWGIVCHLCQSVIAMCGTSRFFKSSRGYALSFLIMSYYEYTRPPYMPLFVGLLLVHDSRIDR